MLQTKGENMKQENLTKIKYYGSLNNRLASHRCYLPKDEPTVGMGATKYMWTDRVPLTVISVEKNWKNKGYDIIVCQRDTEIPDHENGYDYYSKQIYKYIPNPEGAKYYLRSYNYIHPEFGQTKVYMEVWWNDKTNRWNSLNSKDIGFGERNCYQDPSF